MTDPAPRGPGDLAQARAGEWQAWGGAHPERFTAQALGDLMVRREVGADGTPRARMRVEASERHANLWDAVHGGALLGLIDLALFAAQRLICDDIADGSVTLDLSTQFIGAGRLGEPLDAVSEVLKETGRLVFVRGLVEQGDHKVAAFSGTIRKGSRK